MRRRFSLRLLLGCVLLSVVAIVFIMPSNPKDRCDFPITQRYFFTADDKPIVDSVLLASRPHRPSRPLVHYPWRSHSVLPRAFNRTEHEQLMQLTEAVTSMLDAVNVTYMMSFGTLLGSYIFADVIPWDDDLDLLVDVRDLAAVRRLLAEPSVRRRYAVHTFGDAEQMWQLDKLRLELASHDLDLVTLLDTVRRHLPRDLSDSQRQDILRQVEYEHKGCMRWRAQKARFYKAKISVLNAGHPQAGSYNWTWPFVDLIFYEQRGKRICSLDYDGNHMCQSVDITFPLRPRPLGRLSLPAPSDTRTFLRNRFPTFGCQIGTWDHRNERWHNQAGVRHSCDDLLDVYPVVRRKCLERGVRETLTLGETIVTSEDFPLQPCPANNDPFSLE